jgi:hypothetical protein
MYKILIYIMIALCQPASMYAQNLKADDSYEYPVKTGTTEWKSLKSRANRVKSCQIPDEMLKKISTSQLLETCLDYPYFIDMVAFDNIYDGFDKMLSEFNGIRELFKRADVLPTVIQRCKATDPSLIVMEKSLYEKGHFAFRQLCLEMILYHLVEKNQLKQSNAIDILEECVRRYNSKINCPEYYIGYSFSALSNTTLKVLDMAEGKQEKAKLEFTMFIDHNDVYSKAKEYLEKFKLSDSKLRVMAGPPDPIPDDVVEADIYTPACTHLVNTYYTPEMSQADIEYYDNLYTSAYTEAILISSSSNTYNCHGYAWYVSEGGENVWIGYMPYGYPQLPFMQDGSYTEVSDMSDAQKVFHGFLHSDITTETPGWVQSKWGRGPLMKHEIGDCPFGLPDDIKYYTAETFVDIIWLPVYSTLGDLVSSGQVQSSVDFRAGREIRLIDGFRVQRYSEFNAEIIESCWPASNNVESGMYHYNSEIQLSQELTDRDSQSEEKSDITETLNKDLLLYPNPASDILYVRGMEKFDLKITDCYGRVIKRVLYCTGKIDISDLHKGIYIIQISGQNVNHIQKIIKE